MFMVMKQYAGNGEMNIAVDYVMTRYFMPR